MNDFVAGTITSPCVSICALNEADVCIGCYRTANEISEWLLLDDKERLDVLGKCAQRSKNNNPFA